MIQQIREVRSILLQTIAALTDEQLNHHPATDKWSIGQVLYHLTMTDQWAGSAIALSLAQETTPQPKARPVEMVLNRSIKIEAPDAFTPPDRSYTKSELIHLLEQTRHELEQVISPVTESAVLQEKSLPHPILGPISLKQALDLLLMHEQRHTEQIREMI
ncbi:DinB family protein [Brevibacillus dissolubilis]|uniref:DinB family protein n=1 Tax=Brevibacillus dissolubilis TaxID=1844116 RepID=UPI001117288E|nr:DinB family protein [Brevibacillus dissolubilis]